MAIGTTHNSHSQSSSLKPWQRPAVTISLRKPPRLRNSKRRRSVYIVAKPLEGAHQLSFLSEAKFPLCHWALLISPYDERGLYDHILCQTNRPGLSKDGSWGTLFEIFQTDSKRHKVHIVRQFGRKLSPEWSYACIAYVGETHLPDSKISHHGKICEFRN